MKPRKVSAAAAAALTLSLAATACGSGGGGSDDGRKLTVGIKFDQPGVGLKTPDGDYEGFDVDVARYVARQLGYAPSDIVFKEAKSADRETLLQRGDVDFVVASYSINDERRKKVDFAGPYFLAHQDVLVRAGDDSIGSPADLNDKKLCSVTGSTSAQNVKTRLAPRAQLQEYGGYSECLTGLENGTIDAVTTDDAILAGYAAQDQFKDKFRLGGFKLSDELYGIGVKKGDTALRNDIDAALRKMVRDSAWKEAVEANFGPAGYRSEPPPGIAAPAG
ncbi:glutamate-binding protein [Streptomyces spongiicola]|uniref:Glutamate-binding protein n=1 Tax=Streptomyces spongiicola TaxID=1690221 RepID=A0ABN5KRP4_9ACTN|nr:glutamate ABC transporter substrate-binding protein [Streptomyces spongiicola]AWK12822.1 glutamate-binding protein [Streptomyces spongiicola]